MNIFPQVRIACFLVTIMSAPVFAQSRFELLPAQSRIQWSGSYVIGGGHEGTITASSGSLIISGKGTVTRGDFVIDMSSIRDHDVKPARSAKDLEDHLKSEDFFDVYKFPKAFFSILKITPDITDAHSGKYTATGLLTIRSITNQLVFPCSVVIHNDMAHVKADLVFNRTKWDITYHAENFFAGVKDEIISDQIKISVDLALVRTK